MLAQLTHLNSQVARPPRPLSSHPQNIPSSNREAEDSGDRGAPAASFMGPLLQARLADAQLTELPAGMAGSSRGVSQGAQEDWLEQVRGAGQLRQLGKGRRSPQKWVPLTRTGQGVT